MGSLPFQLSLFLFLKSRSIQIKPTLVALPSKLHQPGWREQREQHQQQQQKWELGVDFGLVTNPVVKSMAMISLFTTALMMIRFARSGIHKFNLKLVCTLSVLDFCYALKSLVSVFSIVANTMPGSIACSL